MKKVLFLMLFLMILGAVGVKAQVRIGGNTAPSAAAVLDLNASDAANTGKGGLVLPRVDLQSNTMQLTTGVANVTGTMVYDVTTTLGQIGIFYWNGNTWVKASLPSTSAADSGKILMSNGTSIALNTPFTTDHTAGTALSPRALGNFAMQKVLDTTITVTFVPWQWTVYTYATSGTGDFCTAPYPGTCEVYTGFGILYIRNLRFASATTTQTHLVCYRPT